MLWQLYQAAAVGLPIRRSALEAAEHLVVHGQWMQHLHTRSASPAQLPCCAHNRFLLEVGTACGRQHGGSYADGAPPAAGASPHQLVQRIVLTNARP